MVKAVRSLTYGGLLAIETYLLVTISMAWRGETGEEPHGVEPTALCAAFMLPHHVSTAPSMKTL